MGLGEIEAVRATQDSTEVGEYNPDVQAWFAVNPDSDLIAVTRANGITHIELRAARRRGGRTLRPRGAGGLDDGGDDHQTSDRPPSLLAGTGVGHHA